MVRHPVHCGLLWYVHGPDLCIWKWQEWLKDDSELSQFICCGKRRTGSAKLRRPYHRKKWWRWSGQGNWAILIILIYRERSFYEQFYVLQSHPLHIREGRRNECGELYFPIRCPQGDGASLRYWLWVWNILNQQNLCISWPGWNSLCGF